MIKLLLLLCLFSDVHGAIDENGFGGVGPEPKINWNTYCYEIFQIHDPSAKHEWIYDPKSLGFVTWQFGAGRYVWARHYFPHAYPNHESDPPVNK